MPRNPTVSQILGFVLRSLQQGLIRGSRKHFFFARSI
jgi:hypothetical protein